jgi:DNA-binding transcriptional ArsR family regulator
MMNSVSDCELDVASLHRLRPQHVEFTLHGRMRWLMNQELVKVRRQGLIIYYGLNPDHRLYRPLKRLLDASQKCGPRWWRPSNSTMR